MGGGGRGVVHLCNKNGIKKKAFVPLRLYLKTKEKRTINQPRKRVQRERKRDGGNLP